MWRGIVILGVVSLVTLAAWCAVADSSRAPSRPAEEALPLAQAELAYQGTGSCSASACHGGQPTSGAPWRSSYSVWVTQDKHARAHAVLNDTLAKSIVARLDRVADPNQTKPYEDRRCIGCHAAATDLSAASQIRFADGISCEACHGPAQNWLVAHTISTWDKLSDDQKYDPAMGMKNTKDLAGRAAMCVECHVGSSKVTAEGITRDMNHDMIAAGHPRLNFELSAYMANMPPHWKKATDETKAWHLGQVATTEAALELLSGRAKQAAASEQAVWPEFSEYDCYACHHNLGGSHSYRQSTEYQPELKKRRLGGYVWGSWYLAQTELLAKRQGDDEVGARLAAITKIMSDPAPQPADVQKAADDAAQSLGKLLAKLKTEPLDAAAAGKTLIEVASAPRLANWDEAAQTYLACVALYNANLQATGAGAKKDDPIMQALNTIRDRLRFKDDAAQDNDSLPKPTTRVRLNSPRDYDPADLKKDFKRLQDLLNRAAK